MQAVSLRRVRYIRLDRVDDWSVSSGNVQFDSEQQSPETEIGHSPHTLAESYCNPGQFSPFQGLPQHLVDRVLDSLPPDALLNASRVCKAWRHTVHQDDYKCKRVAWHHKSFVQPGIVAGFRTKRRVLSYAAERRLDELTDRVGKTMLLQFHSAA